MNCIVEKIHRAIIRMRFRPIRIFVFHHVGDVYDPLLCGKEDWTHTDQFKRNILSLQKQYRFISLSDACEKLKNDWFRMRHYAVLTTDDGLSSVLNVLPWLEERKIPLTLFVNTRLMEGNMLKPISVERLKKIAPDADIKAIANKTYLSKEQIFTLTSPLIEVGLHGHEHLDAQQILEDRFEQDLRIENDILQSHPRYIYAYAYPWGHHNAKTDKILTSHNIIPVLCDGRKNIRWNGAISRICIDNKDLIS